MKSFPTKVSTLSGVTRRPLAPQAKRPLAHRELSELPTADPFHIVITFKYSPNTRPPCTLTHTHILDWIKHNQNARIYSTCTVSTFFGVTRRLWRKQRSVLWRIQGSSSHIMPTLLHLLSFTLFSHKQNSIRSCSDSQKSSQK